MSSKNRFITGFNINAKKWLMLVSVSVMTVAGFVTNCSRPLNEDISLNIDIPSTFNNGSLSGTDPVLEMAIVNLRMNATAPAKPYFFENPAGGANLAPGSKLSISVTDNIPVSPNMMVQLLLVFKDGDTNAMRFAYGSTTVDSTKSGELVANVLTEWHGSSTKEGRVAGRYVTGYQNPNYYGPTGTLYTEFNPKLANNPPMIVQTGEIVNGWFSVMILDGTQLSDNTGVDFKYRILKDDGTNELLFANAPGVTTGTQPMNLSHPFFNENTGSFMTYNSVRKVAKVKMPSSFRDESHGQGPMELRGQSAMEFIAGWFIADAGNTDLTTYLTSKVACNPGDVKETIPQLFADPNGVLPIAYTTVTDSYDDTADVGQDYTTYANPATNGTISSVSLQAKPSNVATCLAPAALFVTAMNVFHRGLGEGRDTVFGMQPPFAMQDISQQRNNYMKIVVNHDLVAPFEPSINIKMKLLEGTWGTNSVEGISIFMRQHNFGNYGKDGEDEFGLCNERAIKQGFQFKTDYTTPNPDSEGIIQVAVNAPPGYSSFSYSNNSGESIYNWEYIACPYRTVNSVKRYFKEGIREGCIESCNQDQFYGFGRKISIGNDKSDYTVSTPTDVYTLGQVASRVMNVNNAVSGGFTDITITNNLFNNVNIGDELVAIKMGETMGGCGIGMSQPFESIVVKDKPSTDVLRINRGTFIDNLPTDSGRLTANFSSSPFCYVQVVRIIEFGNLTLTGTGSLNPPPFDSPTNAGGGVIFIRVSGTLDMSATSATNVITADQLGYSIQTNYNGFTTAQSSNNLTQAGAGGSHFGQGGRGGAATSFTNINALPGMNMGGFGGPIQAQFTFGGGGHKSGSSPSNIGGTGGGIIYVSARKIKLGANNKIISADGQMGYGGNAAPAGGGGAGGSVTVITKTIDRTASNTLTASAVGGMSPSSTVEIRAGSGGGGYARIYTCTPTAAAANVAGGSIPDNNYDDSEDPSLPATPGSPGSGNITTPSFCP